MPKFSILEDFIAIYLSILSILCNATNFYLKRLIGRVDHIGRLNLGKVQHRILALLRNDPAPRYEVEANNLLQTVLPKPVNRTLCSNL